MPIFEYLCEDCGNKFEKLVRNGGNGVNCPSCGQEHLKQHQATVLDLRRSCHWRVKRGVRHALMSLRDVPDAGSLRTELGRTL